MIVVLESPLAGDRARHAVYLEDCLRDSLLRGESPVASHKTYVGPLDDNVPAERALGMWAGWDFYGIAEKCVAYIDLGLSDGMRAGINRAKALFVPIEYRKLGKGRWEP